MIFRRKDSANPLKNPKLPYPAQGLGPLLCPGQGDHVFGDIIGVMRTALMAVIGGGAEWKNRFGSAVYCNAEEREHVLQTYYLRQSLACWNEIESLDLGHALNPPLMYRSPEIAEYDNHSLMFGGYISVFQWDLAEIGYLKEGVRTVGVSNDTDRLRWIKQVLFSYEKATEFIADDTALRAYLTNKDTLRSIKEGKLQPHTAISLIEVRKRAETSKHVRAKNIRLICGKFKQFVYILKKMLEFMSYLNIRWDENKWRANF